MDEDLSGCVITAIVIAAIIGIVVLVITYIDIVVGGGLYLLAFVGLGKRFLKLFDKFILTKKSKITLFSIGISSLSIPTIILLFTKLQSEFIPSLAFALSLLFFLIFSIVSLEVWGGSKTKHVTAEKRYADNSSTTLDSDIKNIDKEIESKKEKKKSYEEKNAKNKQEMEQIEKDIGCIDSNISSFIKMKSSQDRKIWSDHKMKWGEKYSEKRDSDIKKIQMELENIHKKDLNERIDIDERDFKLLLLQKEELTRNLNLLREKTEEDKYNKLLEDIERLERDKKNLNGDKEKFELRSLEMKKQLLDVTKNKIKLD